ncbi:ciliogenesis-associated TTC17-interacting protein isoform X2 [Homo sapiens]|uniref:ciliogenesis-associated TTC17-interacting protein isoform X2 n=1 Tax=Homo sapiens TaxID=9606 RepID=UPI0005D032C1|nr:ciliogenesis-associated TTC17-interacting protein isoform X2 [Homo sapiens]XP_054197888.1 ciliogenesis-associated TTC17-interacting protein isoform X2 [Homo sapiens]|eukprot:XP_011509450.1 ciliogenesis-associated TTC17-interacting protein isoform X2 [Homo sapiens]
MSSKVYSTGSAILASHPSVGSRAKDHQPSGPECLPLPEANAEAIDFLSSLHKEELQMLFFSETLAMVSDTGEPQGELTIEVQRGKYQEKLGMLTYCLFVHASSRGFLDKMLCGNSLLGYLSEKLELMEQHSQDFIKFLILPMERKMSLLKQDDQLAVTRSIKEGEQNLGFQTIQVDHQQAEVFIVEQTVHAEEGIPMSCQYYLLSDGHLAKRIQVGSPGCCIITKMPILREEDEIEPRPVFEKKPLVWEEDMELYSKFLDRKEELRLGHASYLRQHPEAHALISDFLLFLLLRQPEDVVTFAAEFFGPFDPWRPSSPALGSSHRPNPFRSLEPEGDARSGAA